MAIELPRPITAYFAADKDDGEAAACCFAADAVVTDEGHDHRGRPAIAAWRAAASKAYSYTVEPFAVAVRDGKTVVTAHVVGNFPGSPVDLRYFFVLDGERIAALEIVP